jgi:L-lactate dehydrogenase complex protein LldE
MKVGIFIPCFIDQLHPQTAVNMVKVLRKVGCEVVYNGQQTCCGQPAHNAGFSVAAAPVCQKFLADMAAYDCDYIVAPSGSCVGFFKNAFAKHATSADLQQKYQAVLPKMYEFSAFLVKVMSITDIGASFEATVTYHDACGALRECGVQDEPRILLQNVKGLTLVEQIDADVCCGFGGTFATKMNAIAAAIGDQKIQNAWETDADFVVSTDTSCLMHLEGIAQKQRKTLNFMHLADVLAQGYAL